MGHPRNVFFRLVYRERTLALRHNFCGGHRFKNHHNYSGVWFETTKNKTKTTVVFGTWNDTTQNEGLYLFKKVQMKYGYSS